MGKSLTRVEERGYPLSMSLLWIFACLGFFIFLCPTKTKAQSLPIFDVHIHYSQSDWSVYSPEAIVAFLDKAGVKWAIVSSTPDDGTIRLFEHAQDRIIPVLRPYRTRSDMSTWTEDLSILSYVEKRLEKGIYRGIGEFHLPADKAQSAVVQGFGRLALRYGIFLFAHTDSTGAEGLLRSYPDVNILWAHAGMSASAETVGSLVEKYPRLFVELSIRGDIASGDRLDPKWKELFLRHPNRFMVGSDTWITSRWEDFLSIHTGIRAWLGQLPKDVAEKLAFKNALTLVGKH